MLSAAIAGIAGCGASVNNAGGSGSSATAPATDMTAFESDLLTRVNNIRAQGANCGGQVMAATPALQWNNRLEQAANSHSQYMKDSNSFSHAGANGSSVGSRVTATGYPWQAVAENIAAGQPDAASVVAGWLGSTGHCTNMLGASYTQLGVALVNGSAGNTYNTYWTMVLARPQ